MNRCIAVNEKIHEMLNFKEIENRIKKRTGLSEGKDIAALFKMTPQNYSNKKGLGTILPTIIEWAIQENVNLDWLLIGEEGEIETKNAIAEPDLMYAMFGTDAEMQEIVNLLQKRVPELKGNVLKILKAKAGLKDALNEMGLKEGDWF